MQKVLFGFDSQQKLKSGINTLTDAVKVTLGAAGQNVLIEKDSGAYITKDGVSILKSISLEDPIENLGAQLIKDVAQKTVDEAGDGTTTSSILAGAIYNEGIKNVVAGANPIKIKKGIDIAVSFVVDFIKNNSINIKNNFENIKNVAKISANNDEEIGLLIANAISQVGESGLITVEESKGTETYVSVVEGMQFDRGYTSPNFCTNQQNMECILENPIIFFKDGKLDSFKDVISLLQNIMSLKLNNRPLLILADDFSNEVLTGLVINKLRGGFNLCAVKSPSYGDMKRAILEDMAILTGGIVCNEENGKNIEFFTEANYGSVEKVIITKNSTTLINGKGNKEKIQERIIYLKNQIENSSEVYDTEKFQERLAKLSGGVAVISVGAQSEIEMKEKKDRVDDAVLCTKSALEEGVIPGGGIIYVKALETLNAIDKLKNTLFQEEKLGIDIIKESIIIPCKQILANANLNSEVIFEKIKESSNINFGFDVKDNEYKDFYKSGLLDSAKVARVALINAASIVGTLLTTKCTIFNVKESICCSCKNKE